jgi:hypothetical protein
MGPVRSPRRPIAELTLLQHFTDTYFSLRLAMFGIAVALPLILPTVFAGVPHENFPSSISAYYGTHLRDYFVGSLCTLGICLWLYKGITNEENNVLNGAGVAAIGVALFPWWWHPWGEWITPHGTCALIVFGGMAWVCWRCAGDSLWMAGEKIEERFAREYKIIGCAMIAFPVAACLIHQTVLRKFKVLLFCVETGGIAAFAWYWLTKSRELRKTAANRDNLRVRCGVVM